MSTIRTIVQYCFGFKPVQEKEKKNGNEEQKLSLFLDVLTDRESIAKV